MNAEYEAKRAKAHHDLRIAHVHAIANVVRMLGDYHQQAVFYASFNPDPRVLQATLERARKFDPVAMFRDAATAAITPP